ncbi:MAG: arsenate reductase (glutaredoxin) [Candidatus Dormibacteraeota bacterium]|nr:arsenate reductase (glutaredoxin) [Candidatus Dormibacteraeota bacterium]MBO0759886.1 arsenate reductase (glutaredoxin) [Candidatus Dormibacteraeota bacterium]
MLLYWWPRCSTCREARQALHERGVRPEERDYFARPLTPEELRELAAAAGGVRLLVATGSPSFRRLGRSLEGLSDAELEAHVLAEPRLLRRPLLRTSDGRVLVGARAIREGAP